MTELETTTLKVQNVDKNVRRISALDLPTRPETLAAITMGKDSTPSVYSLEKPEELNSLLKQDEFDDCLSCRLVGTPAVSVPCGNIELT